LIPLIELCLYFVLSAFLLAKAFQRPIWALGYYMLNYFAQPQYWAWGTPLPAGMRWSLIAAYVMLVSVLMFGTEREFRSDPDEKRTSLFAIFLVLNGLFVHFVFAYYPEGSWPIFVEMTKFVVLYFVIVRLIQSRQDFILMLWFLVLGVAYWGGAARFWGTLIIDRGRLEHFGGPGCDQSNELASIMVCLLPVIIGFLAMLKGRQRLFVIASALLGLNIVMMCQSRGGFISLIAVLSVVPLVASGRARKVAIQGLAVSLLAVVLLAGNPEIAARFLMIFTTEDEVGDTNVERIAFASKESRKKFWKVGMDIVEDYPFGSGGDTFKYERGQGYIQREGLPYINDSVHQGFINEALDWGIQGLLIHLGFIFSSMWCVVKTMRFRKRLGDFSGSFFGPCLLGGFAGFLVGCLVGDFFYLEWGYWLCIISVCYAKIFGEVNYGLLPDMMVSSEQAAEGDPELYRELVASRV
jgi:putative inorganic carbon (HCO3(-)) transporter